MTRKLLGFAGVATILLSMLYIAWPVGFIAPYDANLVRLADSQLQGYCSGDSFMKSQGVGDANLAANCRNEKAAKMSNKPDMGVVQGAFCQAVHANGWQGTRAQCLSILQTNEYWPTYDGNITNAWNRARPYPNTFALAGTGSNSGGGSRTGGHGNNSRTNNPTHSVPSYGN